MLDRQEAPTHADLRAMSSAGRWRIFIDLTRSGFPCRFEVFGCRAAPFRTSRARRGHEARAHRGAELPGTAARPHAGSGELVFGRGVRRR